MAESDIDWSAFNRFPESTCYCGCGAVYRSHSKIATVGGAIASLKLVVRTPCPACKSSDRIYRASSDVEKVTL
jgi:hypothetical protein